MQMIVGRRPNSVSISWKVDETELLKSLYIPSPSLSAPTLVGFYIILSESSTGELKDNDVHSNRPNRLKLR